MAPGIFSCYNKNMETTEYQYGGKTYTIAREGARRFIVRTPSGKIVFGPARTMNEAKSFAQLHADGAR